MRWAAVRRPVQRKGVVMASLRLRRRGGREECSARGVFDGELARYAGAAPDKTGAEHPLPG
jgi:hypothetical protein